MNSTAKKTTHADPTSATSMTARLAAPGASESPASATAELQALEAELREREAQRVALEKQDPSRSLGVGEVRYGDAFVRTGGGRALMALGAALALTDEDVAGHWVRTLDALTAAARCWGDIKDEGLGALSFLLDVMEAHKRSPSEKLVIRDALRVFDKLVCGYDFTIMALENKHVCQVAVELLRIHMEHPGTAKAACVLIWNLTCKRFDQNRLCCVGNGAAALLVRTLEFHNAAGNWRTAYRACSAIMTLVSNNVWGKRRVTRARGIEALLEYLRLCRDANDGRPTAHVYQALQNLMSVAALKMRQMGIQALLQAPPFVGGDGGEDDEDDDNFGMEIEGNEVDETLGRLDTWVTFYESATVPIPRGWSQQVSLSGAPVWIDDNTGEVTEDHPFVRFPYVERPRPRTLPTSMKENAQAMALLRKAYAQDRRALEMEFQDLRAPLVQERAGAQLPEGFWLGVFQNCAYTASCVEEWDHEALRALQDVTCQILPPRTPAGEDGDEDIVEYELTFVFAPNPFFTNTVLQRRVVLPRFFTFAGTYDLFELLGDTTSTDINWTRDLRHDPASPSRWDGDRYHRTAWRKTFFDFFHHPRGPKTTFIHLFSMSEAIRCVLIPNAVPWYLGEAKGSLATTGKDRHPQARSKLSPGVLENEAKLRSLAAEYEERRLALELKHQDLARDAVKARAGLATTAVKRFWLGALEQSCVPAQEWDEPVAEFLEDVSVAWLPRDSTASSALPGSVSSFELTFRFAPNNTFFAGPVLTRRVSLKDYFATSTFVAPEGSSIVSSPPVSVHWNKGKNVKPAKAKGGPLARLLCRPRIRPSMLDVFTNHDVQGVVDAALHLHNYVIPDAANWYLNNPVEPWRNSVYVPPVMGYVGSTAMDSFFEKTYEGVGG